jgi:hypothetical protein
MHILQANNIRGLRATILQIVYDNHFKRNSRLRLTPLHGALERLFFDISEDELVTVLEDLQERGCLTFTRDEKKWKKSRELVIGEIQITPKGRDLVEDTPGVRQKEPGISFE